MKIYKAPEYPIESSSDAYFIFLAGSIEMGKAEDWQLKITKKLSELEKNPYFNSYLIILNPRRDDWDSSWEQKASNPKFAEQVKWELDMLEEASEIIMYFDPNTKSPISLLELGLFAQDGKLKVCCPDGFWRKGNVEIVCERYGIPLYHTMEDLINTIL